MRSVIVRAPGGETWRVRATDDSGTAEVVAAVVGWRAALRARDEMAGHLRAGHREAPQLYRS